MNASRRDSQQSFHAATFQQKIYFTCMSCYHSTILIRVGRSCQFFRQFNNVRCQFTSTYLFAPVENTFVSLRGPYENHTLHFNLCQFPINE